MKMVPVAMTHWGGWGGIFRKQWVLPQYRRMRAEEVAAGGTGFEAIAAKQYFFDRASIAMARANADMVHTAHVGG